MDQYTRRIVGFGIHAGTVDGRALCGMFNHAIRGLSRPKRLSSDHDPLYRFHQWRANLRVLQVTEVKSVPSVPLSHPFVERLIGTLRRECVDRLLFWSASDLEDKLVAFQDFYNAHRAHASLDGRTPVPIRKDVARLDRTDGTRIAAVSIRRRSRRDIGTAKTVASGSMRPRVELCRVIAIAQPQDRASAAHLTHAIARTSRMVPAPAT